jgi:hypothetical protein
VTTYANSVTCSSKLSRALREPVVSATEPLKNLTHTQLKHSCIGRIKMDRIDIISSSEKLPQAYSKYSFRPSHSPS